MPTPTSDLFRPPIVSTEFAAAFEGVMAALAKARAEAEDKLTREQFIEAMKQALACGDFLKHVTVGEGSVINGVYSYSHRQTITYEPYRECERLKARIRELESELEEAKAAYANDHL